MKPENLLYSFIFFLLFVIFSCKKKDEETSPITGSADLLENASDYTGSYPTPSYITYLDNGVSTEVTAYPGQVIIFFNIPISETDASQIINANGGTIKAKIPAIGYYFVSDSPDKVSVFISAMQANSKVDFVSPNITGSLSSGVTILDGCSQNHGAVVQTTLQNYGGTFDECRDIGTLGKSVSPSKINKEIVTEVNQNKTGETLLNLSASGFNGPDWDLLGTTDKMIAMNDWLEFMSNTLITIAKLPFEYREKLVITIAAGNGNMPITVLMTQLRSDPIIAGILKNNVLVVSTTLMQGNYSTTDPDVAICNNPEASNGTSFAAPGAMAIIQNIMRLTGADVKVALKAVKQAVSTNANHELLQSEAIDKANAILHGTTPKTLKLSCVTSPEGWIPSIVAELDQPVPNEDLLVVFTFTRTATTGSPDPWMMQFPIAVDSLVIFFSAGDKVASSIIAGNCGMDNVCSATYIITDAFCFDLNIYSGKLWPKKFIGQSVVCSFRGPHL